MLEQTGQIIATVARVLVPPYEDRIEVTPHNAGVLLLLTIPFFLTAYLTRRPNTYVLRLLLLPITVVCNFRLGFWYFFPDQKTWNIGLACSGQVLTCKALDYALRPEGMLKIGERTTGSMVNKEIESSAGRRLPHWLIDMIELIHEQRGVGWVFGRDTYLAPEYRPLERSAFLRISVYSMLRDYIATDALDTIIKQVPGVGTQAGGSIFFPHLPPLLRYTVSTIIHILTGTRLLMQFSLAFHLTSIIAIGVFNAEPRDWPPIQEKPWISESLHDLWGRRWHQMLRQIFVVYGGYPGQYIAGNVGMAIGTFLGSGLYHEVGMYAMGEGWEWHSIIFFGMQGPLLIAERLYRRVTGKRVHGWIGRLWVYLVIFGSAQMMIDSWGRRGMSGGMFLPEFVSPCRMWVVPALKSLYAKYTQA